MSQSKKQKEKDSTVSACLASRRK